MASATSGPNLVFIIVDDLNDMPLHPKGKPYVATPNIDRLAAMGVSFTNAHCNDPICAPSRASMNFGLYPQTTSLYFFEDWRDNDILNTSVSMQNHLRRNGYSVFGSGKIYHGNHGVDAQFDEYAVPGNVGPFPWDGRKETLRGFLPHPSQDFLLKGDDADIPYQWEHTFGPLTQAPHWEPDEANGVPGYKGWRLSGKPYKYVDDQNRDKFTDELGADWCSEVIGREHNEPFALFVGFNRTHTPLYAPQEYFDRFPLESIELPRAMEGDEADLAAALGDETLYGFRRYTMLERHEGKDLVRKWIQAYMACVSFVDDQVGKVLDAVEASEHRDNTVIIFTSDHGFHVGEKRFLYKHSLWEPSTRVPLMIAGVKGSSQGMECSKAVSLVDLYPTINDLLDLPIDPNSGGNGYKLDGHSMKPFVLDPDEGKWEGPDYAITALPGKDHMHHKRHEGTYYPHFSIRGERWRYTLTSQGGEELYDHDVDPYEFDNVALNPEYAKAKRLLRAALVKLRDGEAWRAFEAGSADFEDFELELEVTIPKDGSLRIDYRSGDSLAVPAMDTKAASHGAVRFGDWNRIRLRVDGDRHQLWINNRVVSDQRIPGEGRGGLIRMMGAADLETRAARIRAL